VSSEALSELHRGEESQQSVCGETGQFTGESHEQTCMSRFEFQDRLEVLGVLAGAFVVVVTLSTLVGLPWTTTEFTTAAIVQVIGIFLTLAFGVAVIVFTRTDSS
jgi:hypothetical protein